MRDSVKMKAILQDITVQVKALLHQQLQAVILFGSYARGDNTADSDMDIMLILDCPKEMAVTYRKAISKIASRIGLEHDIVISILYRTNTEFTQGMTYLPFYQNIAREGIPVYGQFS